MERLQQVGESLTQINVSLFTPDLDWRTIIAYAIGLFLLYLFGRLLVVPMRFVLPLIVNGLIGMVVLLLVNLVGGLFGLRLALNPITALVVGFLGIPGVGLLIALQFLFGVK